MSSISVEPWKRPHLSDEGLLALMNPDGSGVACLASGCPHPGCRCGDVLIKVIPVDFRVQSVSVEGEKVRFDSHDIGGMGPSEDMESAVLARLILDTGELLVEPQTPDDAEQREEHESPVDPRSDALLEPLRGALDAELLDDFARFLKRIKGEPIPTDEPLPDPDLDDWVPGDNLDYESVYKVPRFDAYVVGETSYLSTDLYCTDPACDCNEVIVAFIDTWGSGEDAGAAWVDVGTGEVRFEHKTDDDTLVPGLWRRFVTRHRGISVLLERQAKMKAFGKTELERRRQAAPTGSMSKTQRRAGRKVGRNDPCPCGSGKKFKKCCLPGAS